MKKIFSKIEDFLVIFSRVFWVVVSLLAFVVAIIFLILALNKFFISEGSAKLQFPIWNDVRNSIFPPEITEVDNSKSNNEESAITTDKDSIYVNEFSELLESVYKNFEDYPALIRADITKSSLSTYINSYLASLTEMDNFNTPDVISGLTQLLNQAYIKKDLIKIGNYDSRLELLENSINSYFVKLDNNINAYLNEIFLLNTKIVANKAQSFIYFNIGAASIGTFVLLALFIIIFRVESHLRKMSDKNE